VGIIENKIEDKLSHLSAAVTLEAARTREAYAFGLSEFRNGLRITGASFRAVPVAGGVVYGGERRLVGWSLRETGGTNPVNVDLYDGRSPGDGGNLVATVNVPAGRSDVHSIMPAGVSFTEGLYAVVSGGGVLSGSVWLGAVD
jgi:hypothetical protein